MNIEGTWSVADSARTVIRPDGGVIMDLNRGLLLSLNASGSQIWALINEGKGINEIVTIVAAQCDSDSEQIRTDVERFVLELRDHSVLILHP